MQKVGIPSDNFTYPLLLKAAISSDINHHTLSLVKMVHTHIIISGLSDVDIFIPNSLIDSYSKCGSYNGNHFARKVFDEMAHKDVVSWNSLIGGLVRCGDMDQGRNLFDVMPERDTVSWNTILDGYSKTGKMDVAFKFFEKMPNRNVVSWSTMISGYCKKGDMDMARFLFDRMPVRNLVTWTIIISGYAAKAITLEADILFDIMLRSGFKPDEATMVSILASCAESGLLDLGQKLHVYILKNWRIKCTTTLANSLLHMYAKCGNIDKAWMVFKNTISPDRVSWNSMIQGLAVHGQGKRALQLFSQMKNSGITPDGMTYIAVISACTHTGLVEDGRWYFSIMKTDHNITPQIEHYGCMIDLLARGGLLSEAFELANNMSFEPSAIIWGSLLSACRTHNDVDMAEKVVDRLVKLDPSDSGVYAIMSNIYANAGRWDGMAKLRKQMKHSGVEKLSGFSSIEIGNVIHEFTVADQSHPHAKRILTMIDRLGKHLKLVGCVPTRSTLLGV